MRVVLDTNTLVSGVISPAGPPRRLLDGIRLQAFELCISVTLLAELLDVLSRRKFATRLIQAGLAPRSIVVELRRMAYIVHPLEVPQVIAQDADDDHVLACALAGRADLIVSGDKHLLELGGHYQGIPIIAAAQAARQLLG